MTETATPTETILVACQRCDGKGVIPGFDHVLDGICFACGGSKVERVDAATYVAPPTEAERAELLERDRARREAEQLEIEAREAAARARRLAAGAAALGEQLEPLVLRLAELRPEHRLIRLLESPYDNAGPAVLREYLSDLPGSLFGAGDESAAVAARDLLR